jgi:putative PIG3 family NAD(P)H quinone oxidoreductase
MMRTIKIKDFTLNIGERMMPTPSAHEVLIKVAAAGVNRADVMQRQGLYPPPPGASDILGLEVAGVVAAVGNAVTNLAIGDEVCALLSGGGYADFCLATASSCLPKPPGCSWLEAAALPEAMFTVWSNVFDRAGLMPGETLLVHGGSSGIGAAAIQLAKAFGARVLVTVGSETKRQFCLELGANAAINYQTQDFVEETLRLTADRGVDVILDIVGGDYFPRNLKCLAIAGRLVQIALQNGIKAEINLLSVMLKRLTITGSTLRARDDAFKADIARKLHQKVWPLLAAGVFKPIVHASFPLSEAALAHELMESSQHCGKIVLEVNP